MTRTNSALLAAVVIISLCAPHGIAQSHTPWQQPARRDWPVIHGDLGNTRHSTLGQIHVGNVSQLGAAWVADIGSAGRSMLAHDGRLYLTSGGNLLVLDGKSGAVIQTIPAPGALSKGVAVGDGMAFVALGSLRMRALSLSTGVEMWTTTIAEVTEPVGPASNGPQVGGAPMYAGGVVFGTVVGDHGIRGRVVALDARSGRILWTFYVVPGPGEIGHDTWPRDSDVWKRGGGGLWQAPAVDPELGLVFITTGNAVPQWAGEVRGGDNLFTGSIVAVDLKTGRHRWHFQAVHHDIWELDLGAPPILYDAIVDGRPRKAVAVLRLDGVVFMLDRETGKPIHPIEERPVPQDPRLKTAPTQPFPAGVRPFLPQCVDPARIPNGFVAQCRFEPVHFDRPNVLGFLGGARGPVISYSPDTGLFYVTARMAPGWIRRFEDPWHFWLNRAGLPGVRSYGITTAYDSRTNAVAWQKELDAYSTPTTTAGGLVFVTAADGAFQALDAKTGAPLWSFQIGANNQFSPSVYEAGGEQYIAMVARTKIWAFKLGGRIPALPPQAPPPAETGFVGRVESTSEITLAGMLTDLGYTSQPRSAYDEYLIRPGRVAVAVRAPVTWTNSGKVTHTLAARDGSWRTGPIAPGQSVRLTFDKPGTYTYVCLDHPWSIAELTVK